VKRALALAFLIACSSPSPAEHTERPSDEKAALGGSIAARVGGTEIPVSVVEAVAQTQHITAQEAARKIIDDEIAASVARSRGLGKPWDLTAIRGRLVADRVLAESKAKGLPTDPEVERLSKVHWADVDRPPRYLVVHAVVKRPADPALFPDAKALAEKIHQAVVGATSKADFEKRANAVPHPATLFVKVEDLPPFTVDGRMVDSNSTMDAQFAKGAFAVAIGATSDVVESQFGFHVIRALEKLPEQVMPFEDRRQAFAEEVLAMRGHDRIGAILKAQATKHRPIIEPTAESLMRTVQIGAEQASNP
jgi:peptidyl-prolyl cis-trans isomerase C